MMELLAHTDFFHLALDLSYQTKHVNDAPPLHNLVIGEFVKGHHSANDLFACRRDALERAQVCASQRRAFCDRIPFRNDCLDGEAEVGKAFTKPSETFFESLNAGRLSLNGKEIHHVGSKRFIYRLQIVAVEGVI